MGHGHGGWRNTYICIGSNCFQFGVSLWFSFASAFSHLCRLYACVSHRSPVSHIKIMMLFSTSASASNFTHCSSRCTSNLCLRHPRPVDHRALGSCGIMANSSTKVSQVLPLTHLVAHFHFCHSNVCLCFLLWNTEIHTLSPSWPLSFVGVVVVDAVAFSTFLCSARSTPCACVCGAGRLGCTMLLFSIGD